MDEITTTAPTRISELNDETIRSYDLDPLDFFEDYADPKNLKGGDVMQPSHCQYSEENKDPKGILSF